jgi:hypothetical protein
LDSCSREHLASSSRAGEVASGGVRSSNSNYQSQFENVAISHSHTNSPWYEIADGKSVQSGELTSGFSGKYASAFSERAWADNKSGVHMMTEPKKDEEEEEVEVYDPEKDAGGPPSRPSTYAA